MISLAGGLPNSNTFPYESLTCKLKDGTSFEIDEKDLNDALQYHATKGLPKLYNYLIEHQKRVFQPKLKNWDICVTNGSQDAFSRCFESLIEKGDPILIENPSYSGALTCLWSLGADLIPLPTDKDGIIPQELEKILKERKDKKLKTPKFLYVIPHGSNPSGACLPDDRKEKIYSLACEYNFLILEDDPYFYLTFDKEYHSFLYYDHEGRVIRFDSFSKILSPGMRLGWITSSKKFLEKIVQHLQSTSLNPSGLSEIIAYSTLNKWGLEGFNKHIQGIKKTYRERRDLFMKYADQYLKGLATWDEPSGGMFVWFKLENVKDSNEIILKKAVDKLVLLVPGEYFHPLKEKGPFVRASFSYEPNENLEE